MNVSGCVLNTKTLAQALIALLLLVPVAGNPLAETVTAPTDSSKAGPQSKDARPPPPPASAEELQKIIDTLTVLLADKLGVIEALRLRGEAYASMGRHDLAIADLTWLTSLIPLNQKAWGDLCEAHVITQHLDQARRACEMAVSLGNTRSIYTLGHIWLLQGDRINAWHWYEKGVFSALAFIDMSDLGDYGLQPQLVEEARRWFGVKEREWQARRKSERELREEAKAAQSAKNFVKAIDLTKQRISLLETLHGSADVEVDVAVAALGRLYFYHGRMTDAEQFFSNRISLVENAFGPNHPDLAWNLFRFGKFYHYRRSPQYRLAEPLYKRSLAIHEKTMGPEHPSVVLVLSELAALYKATGRPEAEAMYKRLIVLEEKIDGTEGTVENLKELAEIYEKSDRHSEAESLHNRALAIREKDLWSGHPDVARNLRNLAELYKKQGRASAAEWLNERSRAIIEKAMSADNPPD